MNTYVFETSEKHYYCLSCGAISGETVDIVALYECEGCDVRFGGFGGRDICYFCGKQSKKVAEMACYDCSEGELAGIDSINYRTNDGLH